MYYRSDFITRESISVQKRFYYRRDFWMYRKQSRTWFQQQRACKLQKRFLYYRSLSFFFTTEAILYYGSDPTAWSTAPVSETQQLVKHDSWSTATVGHSDCSSESNSDVNSDSNSDSLVIPRASPTAITTAITRAIPIASPIASDCRLEANGVSLWWRPPITPKTW